MRIHPSRRVASVVFASFVILAAGVYAGEAVRVETLDLSKVTQGWGEPGKGKSVDGKTIRLGGKEFAGGLGTHAESSLMIDLKGAAVRFQSVVGVDDEAGKKGEVRFEVWVDGKKIVNSGVLRGGDAPVPVSVDLTGAKTMKLLVFPVGEGIDFAHADWADAVITLAEGATERPVTMLPPVPPMPVIAMGTAGEAAIHGARVVGTTPGRSFLFLIPATGEGPLAFAAKNIPEGLTLDGKTGIITGSVPKAGIYEVELTVTGAKGSDTRPLRIVAGEHKLAQTPPMGWNSWNCWAGAIDDAKVRAAADAMVSSGLAAHGFQYINIDDCWEGKRDAQGEIQTNAKFSDMKALADYVHSKGLKLGIYSSPGPKTCAGFEGSYQHEEQDAKTYAKWGIDYLKYDWCSYSHVEKERNRPALQKPYAVMRKALDEAGRDIVYSFCQYGMGEVWEWGEQIGGNCWRTTGDITDTWSSMSGIGFAQAGKEKFAGPGHWNDPDMLVVGRVGWGAHLHPTKLTGQEQLTHISLWCLISSPLLIGCDMGQIDPFTLAILTNDEVLAINQDAKGVPAGRILQANRKEIFARPLSDGSTAVGLFNRGPDEATVKVEFSALGLSGPQGVRDLWRKKELGKFEGSFEAVVPSHGVVLVRVASSQ